MTSPILAGIALAASGGLNAFIPLLVVAIADRASDSFNLDRPYDFISSSAGILIIMMLLTVEITADKIPRVDHINDLIQSAIRPAAGAIVFMAMVNEDENVHAVVAMLLGLVIAGSVHWFKTTARPAITVNSGGVGNPLVSLVEDFLSGIIAVLAVIVPLLGVIAAVGSLAILRRVYTRAQRPRGARRNTPAVAPSPPSG